MYTRHLYSARAFARWTRWETLFFLALAGAVVVLYHILDFTFLNVPWTPVALIGTAVAFIVGFQNNAAYGRIWEARKIWGGIVNTSRSWGMKVQDMVNNRYAADPVSQRELEKIQRELVYRHIAWLSALRHGMRQKKKWEVSHLSHTNREWHRIAYIPEQTTPLKDDLIGYLKPKEIEHVMSKGNKATALLYLQSKHLKELVDRGLLWEFSFLELENVLQELFTLQGKSERIKNFPYPRQYASLAYYFVRVFLLLLPFGIVPSFKNIGDQIAVNYPIIGQEFIWLAVPFCAAVSWVFYTMERIARVGENPFEGNPNDVPISTISRGIEIDLRQQMGESKEEIPDQFPETYHVQM
jgi:putative membrane protein